MPLHHLLAALLFCALFTSSLAAQTFADTLWDAVEEGDTKRVGNTLVSWFESQGATLPDDLSWSFRPFQEPINFYRTGTRTVYLSHIPSRRQTEFYWNNWSTVLSDGGWQPDTFFQDDEEAYLLASYNQMVLAAHELGHAVAFRYHVNPDPETEGLNCQEFFADRFATATINDLAAMHDRFARLRERYVALLPTINATVPEENRYAIGSLDDLLNGCGEIPLAYPENAELLVPYASAFFERMRLLLAAEPLSVRETTESILYNWQEEFFSARPYTEQNVEVTTVAELGDLPYQAFRSEPSDVAFIKDLMEVLGPIDSTSWTMLDQTGALRTIHDIISVDADSVWHFRVAYDGSPGEQIELGSEPRGSETVHFLRAAAGHNGSSFSAVVGTGDSETFSSYVLRAHHTENGWEVQRGPTSAIADVYGLIGSPSGKLMIISNEVGYEVDEATLAIRSEPTPLTLSVPPTSMTDSGVLYGAHSSFMSDVGGIILRADAFGEETIAGNGLVGDDDGTHPELAEFGRIRDLQVVDDHTLMVLEELEWNGDRSRIRRITIH